MISVCMATYNGEKFLKEQVDSILEQLDSNDELVVSDDGSSDSTLKILKGYNDSRIKILSNKEGHGVNKNFENALRNAKGDYIFLADQDDVWLPGKVNHCIEALQHNHCVVHDAIITDEQLSTLHDSFFETVNAKKGFIHNWIRNGYLGCAMAFQRNLLDVVLPIPDKLPVWHDIWIGAIANLKFTIEFTPFKGILFRRHNHTTSVTSKHGLPLIKKISYRLKYPPFIIKRLLFHA